MHEFDLGVFLLIRLFHESLNLFEVCLIIRAVLLMTLLLAHVEDVLTELVHLLLSYSLHFFLQFKVICLHVKL
jgi:hypothetical protein